MESLSGHLSDMLNARRLDLAVLFRSDEARGWSVMPLLHERLFLIGPPALPALQALKGKGRVPLAALGAVPLILPSGPHGLRATLDAAFARAGIPPPPVVAEIDSLALLMDAVRAGLGATLQPGAAIARLDGSPLVVRQLADAAASRTNLLASLSDDELSPAGLAARVVLADVARGLVAAGRWPGARLHGS